MTITKLNREETRFTGNFQACGHTINFHFDVPDFVDLTDQANIDWMQRVIEERVRDGIAEDYTNGSLCETLPPANDVGASVEIFGGWRINY